jgi:hypothetical protein
VSGEPKTHGELVAAGLRDECDLRGLISESHNCIDCGYDTNPGCPTRAEVEQSMREAKKAGRLKRWGSPQQYGPHSEVCIVHPCVWEKAGMEGDYSGCLCIGCLEKRIGRRLQPFDFAEHVFNDPNLPGTKRRLVRLLGTELVEGLEEGPELPQASKLDLAFQKAFGKQWRAA